MTDSPPGWHPDPRGRHEHRYWDGSQWTDHVADQGNMSTDPVDQAEAAQADAPIGPSMVNLPAVDLSALQQSAPVQPEPQAAQPQAAEPVAQQAEPAAVAADPTPATATAPEPVEETAGGRSPDLAALLSVVAPGSGHLYLGARGQQRNVAFMLLGAFVAAVILSWFSFPLFLVGLLLWIGAAAYALYDLRAGLSNLREARLSAQIVGLILAIAGGALMVSLLLPYYRISAGGQSITGSGFEVFGIIDIVLLVVGAAALVSGLATLGKGPISSSELPPAMPLIIAVGGIAALVLVVFRMFFSPAGDLEGVSIGRGPGILLAAAASIAILVAAASALSRPKT